MEQASRSPSRIPDTALLSLPNAVLRQEETATESKTESQPIAAKSALGGAEGQEATAPSNSSAATGGNKVHVPADSGEAGAGATSTPPSSIKRKVVIYVAYIGAGYSVSPFVATGI